ncbi:MAG: Ig-like domain-containing protein [Prevotellaceae bacterium]|jgi:uncharacterized protein YjdB|nr:Ig-like domain-containing protein [Prevotellaceae bacterium]
MKNFYSIITCATIMMTAAFFAVSCEEEQAADVPATGVTITPPTLTLPTGSTQQLTATVAPDNASDKALSWRGNKPAVITVTDDGAVTALAVGSATVTAITANGVQGTCAVNVVPVEVTGVTLSEPTLTLPINEAATLTATVAPDNATDKTLTWGSSNETVATVSSDGVVNGLTVGSTTVTATAMNGVKGTCVVTVSTVEVTAVMLSEPTLSLYPNGTGTLTVTVAPDNATDKTVTWSSNDESIVTVNAGTVTAKAVGSATITVTSNSDNSKTATCAVTVSAVPVTGVTLNKPSTTLLQGATETLIATVAPENATDKSVTWSSSDETKATVSQEGLVTAVAVGEATITVTSNADNTKKATCVVTVDPVAVTGVSLNKVETILEISDTETLIATVAPDNATDKSVTWSSSDETKATVSQEGLVTAKATGGATITATSNADNTKKATCTVTVVSSIVNVTSVTLNKPTTSITIGATETLIATVLPPNATDKSVTWSSSDETKATVSQEGLVTAKATGSATITATSNADGTKKATCTVTVPAPPATSLNITLDGASEGATVLLTYTDDATENLTVADGSVTVGISNKTIKSIKIGAGNPILIGRKADSNISLKINGTAIAFHDEVSGFIPIGTYAEFQLVSTALGGSYKLEADLDLMNETWTPIKSAFTGVFDGDHHTVANIYVTATGDKGLFARLQGGTIKNVGVASGTIGAVEIGGFAGGITGYIYTSGTISGCFNNASVASKDNNIGGIAGYCYSTNDTRIIACYNSGSVIGNQYVGGIVGNLNNAANTVIACYNTGNIGTIHTSTTLLGGISGNQGTIIASYNTGQITKNDGTTLTDAIGGNTKQNCYRKDGSGTGVATVFSDTKWPSATENAEWGVGDGSGSGTYWKSLGKWNGGNPVYPKLFFEE